ncbi:MAG: hypothetical protein AABX66_01865 [Nanoarchaeota archaeon]
MKKSLTSRLKEVYAGGTALTWQNVPMAIVENMVGIEPEASANARMGATAVKYLVAPVMEYIREAGADYLRGKGLLHENDPNNGRKNLDKKIGLGLGALEILANAVAYKYIYQEPDLKKALVTGVAGVALTALPIAANFNGRIMDTALDARGLPNNGRSFFAQNTSIEEKRKNMNIFSAFAISFPVVYYFGMNYLNKLL